MPIAKKTSKAKKTLNRIHCTRRAHMPRFLNIHKFVQQNLDGSLVPVPDKVFDGWGFQGEVDIAENENEDLNFAQACNVLLSIVKRRFEDMEQTRPPNNIKDLINTLQQDTSFRLAIVEPEREKSLSATDLNVLQKLEAPFQNLATELAELQNKVEDEATMRVKQYLVPIMGQFADWLNKCTDVGTTGKLPAFEWKSEQDAKEKWIIRMPVTKEQIEEFWKNQHHNVARDVCAGGAVKEETLLKMKKEAMLAKVMKSHVEETEMYSILVFSIFAVKRDEAGYKQGWPTCGKYYMVFDHCREVLFPIPNQEMGTKAQRGQTLSKNPPPHAITFPCISKEKKSLVERLEVNTYDKRWTFVLDKAFTFVNQNDVEGKPPAQNINTDDLTP